MINFKEYESIYDNQEFNRQISTEQEIFTCDKFGNSVDCRKFLQSLKNIQNFILIYEKENLIGAENSEFKVFRGAGIESLEIVLKNPQKNIFQIVKEYNKLMALLIITANQLDIYLVNLGLAPKTIITKKHELEDRYQKLVESAYNPNQAMLTAATASNQVTIDVKKEEIVDVINVFNGFSGFLIALFANSAIYNAKPTGNLCERQNIWKNASNNFIFMPPQFASLKKYFEFICRTGGKNNNFSALERSVRMDCRFRRNFKSVEIRMACQQFPNDTMTVSAFSLGIIKNIKEAKILLKYFQNKELLNLKRKSAKSGFKDFNKKEQNFSLHLFALAKDGLLKRKNQEEKFLETLENRIKNKISPADIALTILKKNGMKDLVMKSSWNCCVNQGQSEKYMPKYLAI